MHTLRLFLFLLLTGLGTVLTGQDLNLANQYFSNGEYEKAAAIFGQLVEKDFRNDYYFNHYIHMNIDFI